MKYVKLSVVIPNFNNKSKFIGSQLRGVFGYALKKVVCINPNFECEGCFAQNNCSYFDFYENKNSYHKYRFDFELGSKDYKFNLYLFNSATKELPYVVSALHQAITKFGFGKNRDKYQYFEMKVNDESIFDGKNFKMPQNYEIEFLNTSYSKDIEIEIINPIRIKKDNRFIKDDKLELFDIVNSIYQRERNLSDLDFAKLPFEVKGKLAYKHLDIYRLKRVSNRQKTTMNIDGIVGKIAFRDVDEKSYRYLKLGEIIGVGKQTTFGLGKIKIKEN